MTAAVGSRRGRSAPLVSVLMPAFNHQDYVSGAVESVWRQTHRPLELVAVDDGSSDATPELLADMAARSPIPMSVHRIANRGVPGALNFALKHASGDWVSVLASDDAYEPEKVAAQLEAAAARPESIAVHSDYLCVGPGGDPGEVHQGGRLAPAEGACHRALLHGWATMHSVTLMVERRALDAIGGWDERYPHEDWPLILRLSRRGEIAYCARRLVRRRIHLDNLSGVMSRRRPFSPDDAAVDLLRELCTTPRELEICSSAHVGVVMRNSIAQGGWRRARGAFAWTWNRCPSRRLYLIGQVARGLRSRVWLRAVRPLLPRKLVHRISAARSVPPVGDRPPGGDREAAP